MGNSRLVAQKHYLQVTDEHFTKAAQNPAQQAHANDGKTSQVELTSHEKTPDLPRAASKCDLVQLHQVGDTGLEPVTSTL